MGCTTVVDLVSDTDMPVSCEAIVQCLQSKVMMVSVDDCCGRGLKAHMQ
jgi:hypothetical protein